MVSGVKVRQGDTPRRGSGGHGSTAVRFHRTRRETRVLQRESGPSAALQLLSSMDSLLRKNSTDEAAGVAVGWKAACIFLIVLLLLLMCALLGALWLAWKKGYFTGSKTVQDFFTKRKGRKRGKDNEAFEIDEHSGRGDKESTDTDWKWRKRMAVEVTLDMSTANPNLVVKGDHIHWTEQRQQRPGGAKELFDERPAVLGQVQTTVPGQYWEVHVGENRHWEVGVATERAPRLGQLSVAPESGFWVLARWEDELKALSAEETVLKKTAPKTVGVYVDLLQHHVSFYDAERRKLLYCFAETFEEPIRPYFSTGDMEHRPLRILPPS